VPEFAIPEGHAIVVSTPNLRVTASSEDFSGIRVFETEGGAWVEKPAKSVDVQIVISPASIVGEVDYL
jgi:hypothetical protein